MIIPVAIVVGIFNRRLNVATEIKAFDFFNRNKKIIDEKKESLRNSTDTIATDCAQLKRSGDLEELQTRLNNAKTKLQNELQREKPNTEIIAILTTSIGKAEDSIARANATLMKSEKDIKAANDLYNDLTNTTNKLEQLSINHPNPNPSSNS